MGLKHCLFGCLLALASVGSAAAMGVSTPDPTGSHATIDSGSRGGGGAGGDLSSANPGCLPDPVGDSVDNSDDGGSGGSIPHPRASHRSSLGWQSLLPGSIQ